MPFVITSRRSGSQYPPKGNLARFNANSWQARGLVGLWAGFDAPHSPTIRDVTGRGNDASWSTDYEGPLVTTSEKFKSRASQIGDGVDSTNDAPSGNKVIPQLQGATNATLITWYRRGTASKAAGIGYGFDLTNRFHALPFYSSDIYFTLDGDFTSITDNSLAWQQLAIVFDASLATSLRIKGYLNGVQVATRTTSKTALSTNGANRIRLGLGVGLVPNSLVHSNWLDARAYNYSLGAEQVAEIYRAPFEVYADNLHRTYFIPAAAAPGARPQGPFSHPLTGALGGPI